jgi:hypothetical protein
MKTSVFWDMPRSALKVNRGFGDTCRLHPQGSRINEASSYIKQAEQSTFRKLFMILYSED